MKIIIRIIAALLGVGCILLGLKALINGKTFPYDEIVVLENGMTDETNEGKYVLVTGHLTYDGQVEDPAFGLSVDSPLLIRSVKMRQYLVPKNEKENVPDIEFSAKDEPNFTLDHEKYTNPDMPEDYVSSHFFADHIAIENGNLEISETYINHLNQQKYIHFQTWDDMCLTYIESLPETNNKDFVLHNNCYYHSAGHEDGIGDLIVTYSYVTGDVLKDYEFSILGKQVNGVLVPEGVANVMWDRVLWIDDVREDLKSTGRAGGQAGIAMGLVLIAGAALIGRKKKTV